ncbi:MAG TPA: hypothetical protein PLQ97_05820 [Myxococcota bacterium]|nr:hypothetical protein [Myxococcota bacterium]HQK50181.1 hypothetical protein [Myxococcota bacterium]
MDHNPLKSRPRPAVVAHGSDNVIGRAGRSDIEPRDDVDFAEPAPTHRDREPSADHVSQHVVHYDAILGQEPQSLLDHLQHFVQHHAGTTPPWLRPPGLDAVDSRASRHAIGPQLFPSNVTFHLPVFHVLYMDKS